MANRVKDLGGTNIEGGADGSVGGSKKKDKKRNTQILLEQISFLEAAKDLDDTIYGDDEDVFTQINAIKDLHESDDEDIDDMLANLDNIEMDSFLADSLPEEQTKPRDIVVYCVLENVLKKKQKRKKHKKEKLKFVVELIPNMKYETLREKCVEHYWYDKTGVGVIVIAVDDEGNEVEYLGCLDEIDDGPHATDLQLALEDLKYQYLWGWKQGWEEIKSTSSEEEESEVPEDELESDSSEEEKVSRKKEEEEAAKEAEAAKEEEEHKKKKNKKRERKEQMKQGAEEGKESDGLNVPPKTEVISSVSLEKTEKREKREKKDKRDKKEKKDRKEKKEKKERKEKKEKDKNKDILHRPVVSNHNSVSPPSHSWNGHIYRNRKIKGRKRFFYTASFLQKSSSPLLTHN